MVQCNFTVTGIKQLASGLYSLLKLKPEGEFALPKPGQFVQVEIPNSKTTYLRRPISVCNWEGGELWLLVRDAGAGTHCLIESKPGDVYNIIGPLGHGFDTEAMAYPRILVGGGVGVAPLLYYSKVLSEIGFSPDIVLGARTKDDLLLIEEFWKYGKLWLSTEDGSAGEQGLVTANSIFKGVTGRHIACCGPTPMMCAVSAMAAEKGCTCEVSLENMMACGLGACLCCVQDTTDRGNVCVCKDGPVFDATVVKW